MKQSTQPVVLGAVALVGILVALGLWWWNADNQQDRRVWNRFRADLTPANVTKIEVGTAQRVLTDTEKQEVLTLLREAKYDKSNRIGHGPTPGATMTLTLAGGSTVQIGIWGGKTFEVSPRHLDPATQFLIESEKLYIWLNNRFKGPAIGAGGSMPPAFAHL